MNVEKLVKVFTAAMFVLTVLSVVLIIVLHDPESATVNTERVTARAVNTQPALRRALPARVEQASQEPRYETSDERQSRCRAEIRARIQNRQIQMRAPIDIKEHTVLSAERQSLRAAFEAC